MTRKDGKNDKNTKREKPRAEAAGKAKAEPAADARFLSHKSRSKQARKRRRNGPLPLVRPLSQPAASRAAPERAAPERAAPERAAATARREEVHAATLPLVAIDEDFALTADELEDSSDDFTELGIGSRVVAPTVRFEVDALESTPADSVLPDSAPRGDVAHQIKALEARLDGLIQSAVRSDPFASSGPFEPPTADWSPTPGPESAPEAAAQAMAVESTAELAHSEYYVRKWGRKGLLRRAEEVDEFGLDRSYEAKLRPGFDFLYRRYFRIQVDGIENIPAEGQAVVVGNHSGTIPIDGLMLRAALRLDHSAARELRWLAEDFLFYLPFAGVFMNRVGAVRACQENAERLLGKGNLIAVFPEGVQGIRKLFRDRYRLQRFGRGGYIRLCLRTRAPLIPCAIIGGEEASPLLYRFDALADLLRIPYLPVTPTFPALGALGLVPAPTKWRIKFGEPIPFDQYGPEAADDHLLVGRLSDKVRATIQSMLDDGLRTRRSVWF